jgi:hypothetical protein
MCFISNESDNESKSED